eukprot:scaffold1033_cov408-Prasinococcus_capsulatus_cf.AAC.8
MDDDFNFDFEDKLQERDRVNEELEARREAQHIAQQAAEARAVGKTAGPGGRYVKNNFRTVVCSYWLRGLCMKGDDCSFLHRNDPDKMPVCPYFSKFGHCYQQDCPFKHSDDDVKECYMYKLGFCVNGPHCRYRHNKLPAPPPPLEETLKLKLPTQLDLGQNRDNRSRNLQQSHRPPPAGYVCHRCNTPGHWIQQCPQGKDDAERSYSRGGSVARYQPPQNRTQQVSVSQT